MHDAGESQSTRRPRTGSPYGDQVHGDELSDPANDAHPSCPRCDTRLDDAGTDTMAIRLRCPNCGLDLIASQ
jgi:tRNA(Ile2) C34 agmatinyltransferase TiaS